MSLRDPSPERLAYDEFIRRACEIAQGDTEKSIKIAQIWDDNFPKALSQDVYVPSILGALGASNFIKDGDNKDEIKVTLSGIYYVADNLGVSPENLGVLSRSDARKLESLFLQTLYEQTQGDPTKTIDLNEIRNRIRAITKIPPFLQIAENLKAKGLIEIYNEKGWTKFGISSQEVKKYYPPPAPPKEGHLISRLSVEVTANMSRETNTINVRKNKTPTRLSVTIPPYTTGLFESTTGGEVIGLYDTLDYRVIGRTDGALNIGQVRVQKDGVTIRLERSSEQVWR